jgi:glycosyltransferase involved in cell wall biosynthesis
MTQLSRVAFIGNSLPRQCGIATFTSDLHQAVSFGRPNMDATIVAMTDHNARYDYPSAVRFQVNDMNKDDYERAADFLNAGKIDVVCLQHEFGIFGGEAGSHILALLTRLKMPIVTTLHTVLASPTPAQRGVMSQIIEMSSRVVVMVERARDLIREVYRTPTEKITVIPHGIPDFPFDDPDDAKIRMGFGGKSVILTFGLLSPNKGVEVMIDAMPSILKCCPNTIYVVLGATHPNLVREQGELYRESLTERARLLGVQDNLVFLDQFVDQPTLLKFISMSDVYVTPYLNEAQMTSGTLAYSFGLGKAVVSTPYWHARELLADGRGILVPFGDSAALSSEIASLLTDDARRQNMRKLAYSSSRSMIWERAAERYLSLFEDVSRSQRLRVIVRPDRVRPVLSARARTEPRTEYLLSMCDDTGLYQHAIHSVPDRAHGYCVDDNARALLLACALNHPDEKPLPEVLTSRFAAFVQHAWNPDRKRFRNFMSFSRAWLEESGSEDSHGRSLWALGACAHNDANASRRRWATAMFREASPPVEDFPSPRSWAFTLIGLDSYCAVFAGDDAAGRLRRLLADKLMSILSASETQDWVWFEDQLAYDNARLPQALIMTGLATATPSYVAAGLRTLRWLTRLQTNPEGHFRPIGSESFGQRRKAPRAFDQQPLEAAATISACHAAWRIEGDPRWMVEAERAFAWFLGANDLQTPLVDLETGSCRDGLHPNRANENRGGESVLSYLLGQVELRQMKREVADRPNFQLFHASQA